MAVAAASRVSLILRRTKPARHVVWREVTLNQPTGLKTKETKRLTSVRSLPVMSFGRAAFTAVPRGLKDNGKDFTSCEARPPCSLAGSHPQPTHEN